MCKYFERLAKLECNIGIAQVEQILENLHPPIMLSNLEIEGYLGKILPTWLMNLQLPNLVHLTLKSCFKCETLPEFEKLRSLKSLELNRLLAVRSLKSIGQVPSLEVLKLYVLPLIKCLDCEFYGGDAAFTRLVELELAFMPELEEWSDVADGYEFLPCLRKLSILFCQKLKKLPSTFCTVTSLEMSVDDQLILGSLGSGGFPNLKEIQLSRNKKDVPVPEVIEERLKTIGTWSMSTGPSFQESGPGLGREGEDYMTDSEEIKEIDGEFSERGFRESSSFFSSISFRTAYFRDQTVVLDLNLKGRII